MIFEDGGLKKLFGIETKKDLLSDIRDSLANNSEAESDAETTASKAAKSKAVGLLTTAQNLYNEALERTIALENVENSSNLGSDTERFVNYIKELGDIGERNVDDLAKAFGNVDESVIQSAKDLQNHNLSLEDFLGGTGRSQMSRAKGETLMPEHELSSAIETTNELSDSISEVAKNATEAAKNNEVLMREHGETFSHVTDNMSDAAKNLEVLMHDTDGMSSNLKPITEGTKQFISYMDELGDVGDRNIDNIAKMFDDVDESVIRTYKDTQDYIQSLSRTDIASAVSAIDQANEVLMKDHELPSITETIDNVSETAETTSDILHTLSSENVKLMTEHEETFSKVMDNVHAMVEAGDSLVDTVDDVSGVTDTISGVTDTISGVTDTISGVTDTAETVSNISAKVHEIAQSGEVIMHDVPEVADGVADAATATVGFGTKLKAVGATIKTIISGGAGVGAMLGAWGVIAAAVGFAIYKVHDALTLSNKEIEEMQNGINDLSQEYQDGVSKAESLNSELEDVNKQISDIQAKGSISLSDQEDLARLRQQSAELERQVKLQEEKNRLKAAEVVSEIRKNSDDLDEGMDRAIENYKSALAEIEDTKEKGARALANGEISNEQYEEELGFNEDALEEAKQKLLEKIQDFEQNRQSIIEKYNGDISKISGNDKTLYDNIVKQLSDVYDLYYSNSEYNQFVIKPILDTEGLEGIGDKLTEYFENGGSIDESSLTSEFGVTIINALKKACELAGIDFPTFIQKMFDQASQTEYGFAPKVDNPNGAYDAKQNMESDQKIAYYKSLSADVRAAIDDMEIPEEIRNGNLETFKAWVAGLQDVKANESAISSFEEAWTSLDSTTNDAYKDIKKNLTDLADNGKLTYKSFFETSGAQSWLDEVGLSADEALEKINALSSSSDQLKSMESGISAISDALATKNDGKVVDASTLAGFDASIKGLDSWDEFERLLGSAESKMPECQTAANNLATEWVNSANFLANLNDENREYYKTQLDNMGVENAAQVVAEKLALKKLDEAVKTVDLTNATKEEIAELVNEANAGYDTNIQLSDLLDTKNTLNGTKLSTVSDIEQLIALANAAGASAYALMKLERVKKAMEGSFDSSKGGNDALNEKFAEKDYNDLKNGDFNFGLDTDGWKKLNASDYQVKPTGSSSYKSGSGKSGKSGKGGSSKDSKPSKVANDFDFLARKIEAAQLAEKKWDTEAGKSYKSWRYRHNAVKNQIKALGDLKDAYEQQERGYKKQANKALNKISNADIAKLQVKGKPIFKNKKEFLNAVANGSNDYVTLKEMVKSGDVSIGDNIKNYIDWFDKVRDANGNVKDTKNSIADLRAELKKFAGTLELIPTKIDNIQRKIQRFQNTADDSSNTYKKQVNALKKQVSAIQSLENVYVKLQEKTQKRIKNFSFSKDAKKSIREVGFTEGEFKKLIKNGALKDLKIKDEDLLNQSNSLQELYDKYKSYIDGANDQITALHENWLSQIDKVQNHYDNLINGIESRKSSVQSTVDLIEDKGKIAGEAFYRKQINLTNQEIDKNRSKLSALKKEQKGIKKGTDDWWNLQNQINSTTQAINEQKKAVIDLTKSLNNVHFSYAKNAQNDFEKLSDEMDFLRDLFDENELYKDNGDFTKSGYGALGLAMESYDSKMYEQQYASEQIELLKKNKKKFKGDEAAYKEQMEYWQDLMKTATSSAHSIKNAVVEYIANGLNKMNEALSKKIDLQKKDLESQKDLKDFQDSITESTDNLSKLKKREAFLAGDDSKENRKTLQQLRQQIKDAEKALDDKMYDRSISDQEKYWDNELKASQDKVTEYLKDNNRVFVDAANEVNDHTKIVSRSIQKEADEWGYSIQTNLIKPWKTGGDAVTTFNTKFENNSSGIITTLDNITSHVQSLESAANVTAKALQALESIQNLGSDERYKKSRIVQGVLGTKGIRATKAGSKASDLNKYLIQNTGYKLDNYGIGELARGLGIPLAKDHNPTSSEKDQILKALKAIGIKKSTFAKGGMIRGEGSAVLKRLTGNDDLLHFAQNGEYVMNPEVSKAFIKSFDYAPQIAKMYEDMIEPKKFSNRNIAGNINVNIENNVSGIATNEVVSEMSNQMDTKIRGAFDDINRKYYAKGGR